MTASLLFIFIKGVRMNKKGLIMNIENMIQNDIEKGIRAARNEKKRSVKCNCGCVVRYRDFNIFGWGVCPRCGSKVMKPKDAFKDKLSKVMKGEK